MASCWWRCWQPATAPWLLGLVLMMPRHWCEFMPGCTVLAAGGASGVGAPAVFGTAGPPMRWPGLLVLVAVLLVSGSGIAVSVVTA